MMGEALKLIRWYHAKSQSNLSGELCGFIEGTQPSISSLESDEVEPTVEVLRVYARTFDLEVWQILKFATDLESVPTGCAENRQAHLKLILFANILELE